MEKTKKSISLVALVLALVLLAGVVGYVVYAAVNQSFNFGGKVTFEADGVNATVTAGETTNCTITNDSEDALQTIIYSTKVDEADTSGEDSWDNLTVTLSNSPATFTFSVANTSTTDSLYVTIGTITYTNTYSNNEITVKTNVDEGEETEVDPSGSLEIIVTFTVANTNFDAELTSFTLPVTLSNSGAVSVSLENFSYSLNSSNNTATLTSYTGSESVVTISSTIDIDEGSAASALNTGLISAQSTTTYTVTEIGKKAFSESNCESITTIVIPSTIITIGETSFSGCSNLTKINNLSSISVASGNYGLPSEGLTVLTGGHTVTLQITYDGSSPVSDAAWAVATDTGEIQGGDDGSFSANAIYDSGTYTFIYYNVNTIYLYDCSGSTGTTTLSVDKVMPMAASVGGVSVTITGATSGEKTYGLEAGSGSSCAIAYTITLTQDVTIVAC